MYLADFVESFKVSVFYLSDVTPSYESHVEKTSWPNAT